MSFDSSLSSRVHSSPVVAPVPASDTFLYVKAPKLGWRLGYPRLQKKKDPSDMYRTGTIGWVSCGSAWLEFRRHVWIGWKSPEVFYCV